MDLLLPIYIFAFFAAGVVGSILASFFVRLIMRTEGLTKAESSRSQCDHCGRDLAWHHLIPIVSYLWLRGKCGFCQKPIDLRIWLSEVVGFIIAAPGGIYIYRVLQADLALSTLLIVATAVAITVTFIYLAAYDIFFFAIPTRVVVGLAVAVIVINVIALLARWLGSDILPTLGYANNLLTGGIAALVVYALMLATKKQGLGLGDVYIAFAIGAFFGLSETVGAFYIAIFTATAVGLAMVARQQKFKNVRIALVPFLAMGFSYALIWGAAIFGIVIPYYRVIN